MIRKLLGIFGSLFDTPYDTLQRISSDRIWGKWMSEHKAERLKHGVFAVNCECGMRVYVHRSSGDKKAKVWGCNNYPCRLGDV